MNKYMIKIVNESIDSYLNEGRITKSYEEPMNRERMKDMISTALLKFKKDGGKVIYSMSNWLSLNNMGSYTHNRWVKAMVDTLFKYSGGVWTRINRSMTLDELTDHAMTYWDRKLKKNQNP